MAGGQQINHLPSGLSSTSMKAAGINSFMSGRDPPQASALDLSKVIQQQQELGYKPGTIGFKVLARGNTAASMAKKTNASVIQLPEETKIAQAVLQSMCNRTAEEEKKVQEEEMLKRRTLMAAAVQNDNSGYGGGSAYGPQGVVEDGYLVPSGAAKGAGVLPPESVPGQGQQGNIVFKHQRKRGAR
eukprot:g4598.t1